MSVGVSGLGRSPSGLTPISPVIDKRRERAGVSEVMNIMGDVKGRRCILVDDTSTARERCATPPRR